MGRNSRCFPSLPEMTFQKNKSARVRQSTALRIPAVMYGEVTGLCLQQLPARTPTWPPAAPAPPEPPTYPASSRGGPRRTPHAPGSSGSSSSTGSGSGCRQHRGCHPENQSTRGASRRGCAPAPWRGAVRSETGGKEKKKKEEKINKSSSEFNFSFPFNSIESSCVIFIITESEICNAYLD